MRILGRIATGAFVLLLALSAVWVDAPVRAAGVQPVKAEPIFQYQGKVYAAPNFKIPGWKEVKGASSLLIAGDYIYYLSYWDYGVAYGGSIYRTKLDGSGKTLITKYCNASMYLRGGKLYFGGAQNEDGKGGGIYTLDVKTRKKQRLISGCDIVSLTQDYIYYRPEKGGVYRCSYTGASRREFATLTGYDYGTVYKDYYYTAPGDDDSIYRIETKNPARFDRVTNNQEYWGGFYIYNDYIYFSYNKAIYSCKVDGTARKRLCSLSSKSYGGDPVKVVGSYLYFIDNYTSGSNNCFLYRVPVSGGAKAFTNKKWFAS